LGFDVRAALADGAPVLTMTTMFGFFPARALAQQAGLPITAQDAARLRRPLDQDAGETLDYLTRLRPRLPSGTLLMLDRVVAVEPQGGTAGLGTAHGEKDVRPDEWFFKAHFFRDPVQPGS